VVRVGDGVVEIRNEFAAVTLSVDGMANAPRLRLRDLETGAEACVDAFVLRSLCLVGPEGWLALCRATVPADPAAGGGGSADAAGRRCASDPSRP
jgi:hypothetical protein